MFSSKELVRAQILIIAVGIGLVMTAGRDVKADFVFGEPMNLGPLFNTSVHEYAPCLSSNGLELYFARGDEDLWVARRATPDSEWSSPTNLGPIVNIPGVDDGRPSLSADGLTLYFDSPRPGGYGGYDLWMTTRPALNDDWGPPVNLGATVNAGDDWAPCISADGLELFFTSIRSDGFGADDLWVAKRATVDDDWSAPVNLGATINTPSIDAWPSVSADGLLLFFVSTRPGGYGWFDLWVSRRSTTADPWASPINLGPKINTAALEHGGMISADGSTLYFDSTRSGGAGGADLWQVRITRTLDLNDDGTVDSEDKAILMDHWGQDGSLCDIGPMPWGDGIVDSQDMWVLAEYVDVDDVVMVHSPGLHAADVSLDVTLHWLPAEIADTHDVYFGTSFEDVYAADRDDPRGVLVSQDQDTTEFDPGQLAFGQTYYWRIDEVTTTFEPTIYKGVVMDFTTESLAYPVEKVSATASTSDADAGPENTINGSGLSADDTHSTAATDMWLASGNGVDPIWIQYEFDKVYKLHEMLVWNYNVQFELVLGLGLKDVTVAYSENGMDWTVLGDVELAQATAAATYTANTTIEFGGEAAKYVRLTVNGGWGITGKFGLSEVRFYHIPARARKPEPVDGETGVSPDTILSWHAGREAALHEVYLSTDRQAVVDGTALVDTVTENGYLPEPLDPGQTYYWKINEIHEAETVSAWEGDVWQFTTAD